MTNKFWLAVVLSAMCGVAGATTWNEPWQLQVVSNAKTLALYRVDSLKDDSATVTLVKHLAGEQTKKKIRIAAEVKGIGLGDSHGEELWLEEGESYYLYLSPGPRGTWTLPTPSSGSDPLSADGLVAATYRISMHRAQVPRDIYELTQICIFEVTHARECDRGLIDKFITEVLTQPVTGLNERSTPEDFRRFSLQHAALETAAALQAPLPAEVLARFEAEPFFHVQMSVLKYLSRSPIEDRWHRIARVVCNEGQHALSRGYGALLIGIHDARSEAATLESCTFDKSEGDHALTELMDPRIGTDFPYELSAYVKELLERWKSEAAAAHRLVYDLGHGQTSVITQMRELGTRLGFEIAPAEGPLTLETLRGARLLYLRSPTKPYADGEKKAVIEFVRAGGSLLLVFDEERRTPLAATGVNEIIGPLGLELTDDTGYLHNAGALATAGAINRADRELPYSGGRAVKGGTAFAWQLDRDGNRAQPFASHAALGSARVVVMADAMASAFMGKPEGVRLTGVPRDPQNTVYWGKDSAAFMEEVLAWLLER